MQSKQMTNWTDGQLGDFMTLQRGFDLPRQDRRAGTVPVVSSSGVSDHVAGYKVKAPGVVTGRYGTIGQVFYLTEDFWPLNTTLYVKDFKGNDPQYVSYFLRTVDYSICNDKSSVPGVNRNDLHTLPASFPPLEDQRSVAGILGALDDKIELNRRMNETLEAMARALFKCWFVDFEPVRIKQAARLRGADPTAALCAPPAEGGLGLSPDFAALFPDSFEDSELGEIPKGWQVGVLSDFIQVLSGGTPKRSESSYWNGTVPWYTVRDAPRENDVFVVGTSERITQLGIANSAAKLLDAGTTIVSARGTVGKLAILGVPMAMNQSCYGLRGKTGYSDYYVFFALKHVLTALRAQSHGSVFDTITTETFNTVESIVPNARLAQAFDMQVTPILSAVRSNLLEQQTLKQVRDGLLPKLISGELHSEFTAGA